MALAFRFPASFVPRTEEHRPKLEVIRGADRRHMWIALGVFGLVAALFGVVGLRAHMADTQMRIDSLTHDISRAREHFDALRAERARLQSPEFLIPEAQKAGMVPSTLTRIVGIPATTAADVAANVGSIDADVVAPAEAPLDAFGRLKVAVVGAP